MKSVKYHGPHDAVEIEIAPRLWQTVAHGASIEVTDKVAANLLAQNDNWCETSKKAAKAANTED